MSLKIEITNPDLRFLQKQYEDVFKGTKDKIDEIYPQLTKLDVDLQNFRQRVNGDASKLQHQKIVVPEKSQLEKTREGYLQEYWTLKETSDKINFILPHLQKSIQLLTPIPRTYTNDFPDLVAQQKRLDEICQEYLGQIKQSFSQLQTLDQKTVSFINHDIGWALQRFCQIVDNNGKPLNYSARAINNLTVPVIPKPQVIQKNEDGKKEMDVTLQSKSQLPITQEKKNNEDWETLIEPVEEGEENQEEISKIESKSINPSGTPVETKELKQNSQDIDPQDEIQSSEDDEPFYDPGQIKEEEESDGETGETSSQSSGWGIQQFFKNWINSQTDK